MKQKKIKSIGVLCSGGDAPGMNAAVRAVVRYGIHHGLKVFGIYKGYAGLLEGNIEELTLRSVANIIQRGGTVIKTSRCKPFFQKGPRAEAVHILKRKEIDGLIVIGGDGSYTGAHLMSVENEHYPVIGVPGTIDNDVYGSDYTIGFDTAVNTAVDAIDKIRDTASSHDRVFLVEVMGRTSAEIAARVGLSGGAESILAPDKAGLVYSEKTMKKLTRNVLRSAKQGKLSSIIVVCEGEKKDTTYHFARALKTHAKIEPRVAILGHIQRGGVPSAMDRTMASLMGAEGVQALMDGHHGVAIGWHHGEIVRTPFSEIIGKHKKQDTKLIRLAEILAS